MHYYIAGLAVRDAVLCSRSSRRVVEVTLFPGSSGGVGCTSQIWIRGEKEAWTPWWDEWRGWKQWSGNGKAQKWAKQRVARVAGTFTIDSAACRFARVWVKNSWTHWSHMHCQRGSRGTEAEKGQRPRPPTQGCCSALTEAQTGQSTEGM